VSTPFATLVLKICLNHWSRRGRWRHWRKRVLVSVYVYV